MSKIVPNSSDITDKMKCLAVEDSKTKRQKAPDWSEPAEIVLNALVRDRWSLLSASIRGLEPKRFWLFEEKMGRGGEQNISVSYMLLSYLPYSCNILFNSLLLDLLPMSFLLAPNNALCKQGA